MLFRVPFKVHTGWISQIFSGFVSRVSTKLLRRLRILRILHLGLLHVPNLQRQREYWDDPKHPLLAWAFPACSLVQLCSTGCLSFLFHCVALIRFYFAGDPFAHSKSSNEEMRSDQEPISEKTAVGPRRQDKFPDKKRAPVFFLTMLAVYSWCSFAHVVSPGDIYKNTQKREEPLRLKSTGRPQWQRNVTRNGKNLSCDRPLVWPPSSGGRPRYRHGCWRVCLTLLFASNPWQVVAIQKIRFRLDVWWYGVPLLLRGHHVICTYIIGFFRKIHQKIPLKFWLLPI